MLTKRYLDNLGRWEVVILANHTNDDLHIGLYESEDEAKESMKNVIDLGGF
jgi:sucrose-6-phosphate hydrolase SacC (GH32 family)